MGDPFLAEIRIFSFDYAPKGWAACNGQFLPINQNQALFSLLGTMYGGNGQTTFALPDLRGRLAAHFGPASSQGQRMGEEAHTLTLQELPQHTHPLSALTENASANDPTDRRLAASNNAYGAPPATTTLHPASVTSVGGGQPHMNMQPYLTLNFCIALVGIFPSRN